MEQIFCENCGTSLKPHHDFCPDCGTPTSNQNSKQQVGNETTRAEKTVRKAPLSTKKKVGLSLIVLLAVFSNWCTFSSDTYFNRFKQQLQAIHNAIVDENGKALQKNSLYLKTLFMMRITL